MADYSSHKFNNCVVEILNHSHGKKVIEWWTKQGVDTYGTSGANCREDDDASRYYGLYRGEWDYNTRTKAIDMGCRIITIEEFADECSTPNVKKNTNHKLSDFSVGMEVMFNELIDRTYSKNLSDYHYGSIPKELVNTSGSSEVKENKGIVTAIHKKYIVVEFADAYGKKPRLGFLAHQLTIINNSKTKTQHHGESGIKVQRVTPTVSTGKRGTGHRIYGRRSRTTVTVGHLSHKAVIGH